MAPSQPVHELSPATELQNTDDKLPFMLQSVRSEPDTLQRMKDDQLIDLIRDTDAEISKLQALQLRAIADLSVRRRRAPSASSEVALALSITEHRASAIVSAANALIARLPRMLNLMDDGRLDLYRAMKVTDATAWLSGDHVSVVDAALEDRVPGRNATQVRRAAAYAAAKVDPEGAALRTERKFVERRFALHHQDTGVTHLSVNNAPTEKATAAYARIDRAARALKTADEPRTLDQLRADVAMDLLLSGTGGPSERTEVFLHVDLETYLNLNESPAALAGRGPIAASVARHIIGGPDTTLRRVLTDPRTGQAVELSPTRYPLKGDEFIRVRDQECRQPGCTRPAQNCGIEATRTKGKAEGAADQPITYCSRHRRLKGQPGWDYEVTSNGTVNVATPAGQVHSTTPPSLNPGRRRPNRILKKPLN
ncbi:HNH endonuclease [Amycolatopsis vastitatis]|uniref:HNH endonuclease n=2 Tax=Amycolatopsis vastitatis TaxID=1905142 RepID=A0A229SZ66_9PSEU|nr:HNH endonuclease [Amycolatopsis vastitatis]